MARNNIILVGLGNPGNNYSNTRHNIGFMVIDAIAHLYNCQNFIQKFKSLYSEFIFENFKVILLKPQSFMNKSGIAVSQAVNFFKSPPQNILVIHDELELQPFQLRYKIGGGNAGHNGLKSIDALCGKEYARLRVGIGKPAEKAQISNYVLQNFTKAEEPALQQTVNYIAENILLLLNGQQSLFLTKQPIHQNK